MYLNKFLAYAGVCSRRAAVQLIATGQVRINGKAVREPFHDVVDSDCVMIGSRVVNVDRQELVYIVLNKPKGYITSAADDKGRQTVVDLIRPSVKTRIFPVGRLDVDTTGVLLLTNDGESAHVLTHPRYEVKKVYDVTLSRALCASEEEMLRKGVNLEDGFVKPDEVTVLDKKRMLIRIAIHSGRNRIVRRMFAAVGQRVAELDRIQFGFLNHHTIGRGQYKKLSVAEVKRLRSFVAQLSE